MQFYCLIIILFFVIIHLFEMLFSFVIELRVKAGGEQRVLLECGNSGRTTASQRLQFTEKRVFMDCTLLHT